MTATEDATSRRSLAAALDPGSSLVDVLVAIVIALGLVTASRGGLLGDLTPAATAVVLLTVAVAWGVIDAGLYRVGTTM